MNALDTYNASLNDIYQYFGYEPEWHVYPIEDCRGWYWRINGDKVEFGNSEEQAKNRHYVEEILKVYPASDFTMIKVDTQTDGNKFLSIFDNSRRVP
jgi:predicted glycosyltransferase involved in capsule biosynthesis